MNGRIERLLEGLRQRGATGVAAYLVAGDPDAGTTLRAMESLVEAGVSLLEIGLPFSDPVADGPSVAAAHGRALAGGMTTSGALEIVRRFRERDADTPVVAMGYANPILSAGLEPFFSRAARCGLDGLIAVDVPLEHSAPWAEAARAGGMSLVPLWAPTAPPDRERRILSSGAPLAYMVTRTGITGAAGFDAASVRDRALGARREHGTGIAAGFGIRTPEQARSLSGAVDLVVVGSLFVEIVASTRAGAPGLLAEAAAGMVAAAGS